MQPHAPASQSQTASPNPWSSLPGYGPALVLLILAIPLGLLVGFFYGAAALILAAFSFITARQVLQQKARAEQQTAQSGELLLQSQKLAAIGELSAGIAHEINNPLAIIRQEAEWLLQLSRKESSPDLEEIKNCLTEIVRQVDRSREITQNLLNFARRRQPVVQAVDLTRLIEDMTLLVEKEALNRHITINKQFQPDLPVIFSDSPLLRQLLLNLLNNAIQAVGQDGTVTIITRVVADKQVMIQINDTGCGISKEHLTRLFDPFFTTKPPGKGTGLGLSICHGIVERLGGGISVASEEGKGSSFTIKLPQALAPQEI
ncbi:MAG: ATP-binding protein [Syntrophales bacterium]|nr:ATP-binding protein [Syntrophales bacterium]